MLRILDLDGEPLVSAEEADALVGGKEKAVRIYETMTRVQALDDIFYQAQRQGRISFYLQSLGEEAATVATAAALHDEDEMFAQYRECGALMWRGYTMDQFANQCTGNAESPDKGRTMPIHYGSKKLHHHTISSPLATQIPHAVGAGLALKSEAPEADRRIAVSYFGDGAASEGDFFCAVNFASTLASPTLLVCRNNGWAISTPASEQYSGDGIASRACALGMDALRCDGNDAVAIHAAVSEMRKRVAETQRPALVELMTYRLSHHSTSDDSTKYRPVEEIREHHKRNPVDRFRKFLEARGWWDEDAEAKARLKARQAASEAIVDAEKRPKPEALESLFEDVYDAMPASLERQMKELKARL